MIVILITIIIILLILAYSIFKNMLKFSEHPTTILLVTWFFSLALINLLLFTSIYGYYYYKTSMNPYQGNQGIPGYQGENGSPGNNAICYKCDKSNQH